jgi:hypothetical protein
MPGDIHLFTLNQPESAARSGHMHVFQQALLKKWLHSSSPFDGAVTKKFNSHRTELCFGQEQSKKLGERSHRLGT